MTHQSFAPFHPEKYFNPVNAEEAVGLLERYGESACLIAGGTDLMVDRDSKIRFLVDVTGLGLQGIRSGEDGLSIGAASRIADLIVSPAFREVPFQIVSEAARSLGTPQIRNMATLGGNLCRPSPAADMAPPLLALNAKVKIAGKKGLRELPIEEFFVGVKQDALQPGEMVMEVFIPFPRERTGTAFFKKGRVAAGDLSIINGAVFLAVGPEGRFEEVRIALGAVAPVPMRARSAEKRLKGEIAGEGLFGIVAEKAAEEIQPISDLRASAEYRRVLCRVLVERALGQAFKVLR